MLTISWHNALDLIGSPTPCFRYSLSFTCSRPTNHLTDLFRPFIVAAWAWTRLSFTASTDSPGGRACWIGSWSELAKPGNLLYPVLLAAAYWAWVQLAGMSDRLGDVGGGGRRGGCVGHTAKGAGSAAASLCDARGCASIARLRRRLFLSFQSRRQHGGGGGLLPGPLSKIRLDQLAAWWRRSVSRACTSARIT